MPTIVIAACLVAVVAAIRSTWSPCGLSMMSTITPFGEQSKGHRYAATAAWFILGSVLGGLCLGAGAAGLAVMVQATGVATLPLALAAALVAVVSDTAVFGIRLPVHHRQVNERWLDVYRPWVYAGGFGWQIGTGLATYITTSAVYLLGILAALTGKPVVAVALGGGFGLLRGMAVLLTARTTSPASLLVFHRRFAAARPWADRLVVATLVVVVATLAMAVGLVGVLVAMVVAVAAILAATMRWVLKRRTEWPWSTPSAMPSDSTPLETVAGWSRRSTVTASPSPGNRHSE